MLEDDDLDEFILINEEGQKDLDDANDSNDLDDLGILGPNKDFGELYYEDIIEENE